jgi:hypothetical protein
MPPPFNPKIMGYSMVLWQPFTLSLTGHRILIDSLIIHNTDPHVPFEVGLFTSPPTEIEIRWDEENILTQTEPIQKQSFTWQPVRPIPYQAHDNQKRCYWAIAIGQRPLRFDIDTKKPKASTSYYQAPVEFTVTLRYLVDD